MTQALYILLALILLSLIVSIHEFGHYFVARLCGINVVEFSVGFGPKLLGWKRKGIQYSLRCIPLGGYCSFGEDEEDAPLPDAFSRAPVWKRFLTLIAGPGMNFLLAFVACIVLLSSFYYAELQPRISAIGVGTPAQSAGFELGDIVTKINGVSVSYDGEGVETVREIIRQDGTLSPLEFTVERDGEELLLSLTPELISVDEATGQGTLQIGVSFGGRYYSFPEAVRDSFGTMAQTTSALLDALKDLIFKGEGVEEMSGTVGTVVLMSDMMQDTKLEAAVYLTVFISLNLGVINLLPLPALDGGRLLLLLLEALRGKPLPREKEGMVHAIGFLLLIGVFVFFTYHDIVRLIAGG